MSKTSIEYLTERRDHVDELFLTYVRKETLMSNIPDLSRLALIGGRLDTMIRREQARQRTSRRSGEKA